MFSVSIIIPVYNTAPYLNACLESILRQSYDDFELLLIDDGSSDGSGAICDTFARKDSRVVVFHTENKGVSSARNLGLDHAQGTFVMFVDSDDELPDRALEDLISETADFSVGGMLRIIQGRELEYRHSADAFYQECEEERFLDDSFSVPVLMESPGGKLFRKDIICRNGLRFNELLHYGEDKLFVYTYLVYAKSFKIITDIVYIQKRREGSLSSDIVSPSHMRPLIDFLMSYVDVVKVYQNKYSCHTVKEMYQKDVIRRYVFRYLLIVRTIRPRDLSCQDLTFISSLLKGDKNRINGVDRAYLKYCVCIGKNLPDTFLYGFIFFLNTIR